MNTACQYDTIACIQALSIIRSLEPIKCTASIWPSARPSPHPTSLSTAIIRIVASSYIRLRASIHSSKFHYTRPVFKQPPPMNATQAVLDWIAAHPYQTAFHIVNGVIICTPAAATVPFLAALGFGTTGPVAGRSHVRPSGLGSGLKLMLLRHSSDRNNVILLNCLSWRHLRNSAERGHGRLRS